MSPTSRLLWIVGLAIVPAATLGGVMPSLLGPMLLLILAVFVLLAGDFIAGLGKLRDAEAEIPPVLHATKGRPLLWTVSFSGIPLDSQAGMAFPLEWEMPEPIVALKPHPAPKTQQDLSLAIAEFSAKPWKRGRYVLSEVFLETTSPLGLWHRRRAVPLKSEIRVYPDLRQDRRGLAAVFLNRSQMGAHTRAMVGKGREFDHLREYSPGDDFGDIHWKTTARRGHPVTKTFQVERTREVYVVLDHSRLSGREMPEWRPQPGQPPDTQLERCLQAALVLGLAAQQNKDLFGLVTFSRQITRFLRSGNGQAHYNTCRDLLYTLQATTEAPDFDELFVFLRKKLTKRALLVFLTDLSDPVQAESFLAGIKLISRHHLCLVIMVQPPGAHPLFTDEAVPDDLALFEQLAGHYQWHDLQEAGKVLRQCGVHFAMASAPALSAEAVNQYMIVKRRQLL